MKDYPGWFDDAVLRWADEAERMFNERQGDLNGFDKDYLTALLIHSLGRADDEFEEGVSKREYGIEWTERFLNVVYKDALTGKQVAKAEIEKAKISDDEKTDYVNAAINAIVFFTGCARARIILERFTWVVELVNVGRLDSKEWVDVDYGRPKRAEETVTEKPTETK